MSARRNPNLLSFRELHTNALLSSKAAKNPAAAKESQTVFRDCADVFKAGRTTSGVYTLTFPNSTEEVKVRGCACVAGPAGLQDPALRGPWLHVGPAAVPAPSSRTPGLGCACRQLSPMKCETLP